MMTIPAVLISHPVMPWWVVLPCGMLFAWLAWMTYGKCKLTRVEKGVLWCIRMAAFLLLAWMLLQQSLRSSRKISEKPAVAVVTDFSASMEENPIAAEKTRAERAREFMKSRELNWLKDHSRLQFFGIGDEIRDNAMEGEFNAPSSMISQQLARIISRFRGDNLAAIVLLSDGLDQSPEAIDPETIKVPVYIPELEEIGEPVLNSEMDFAVGELAYPKRVTVNWKTGIGVAITRLSGSGNASFPVKLMRDGASVQEEKVDFTEKETTRRVNFQVEPSEIGSCVYQIKIEPQVDSDSGNNQKDILIEVTDNKHRVLYLEGTPRWEFKFLKRSLLAENNLQLNAFVKFGDGSFISFDETNSGEPMPPITAEGLRQYRTIIIGDLTNSAFSEEEATEIKSFVEKGGALLVIGGVNAYKEDGAPFMNGLADVMPASYKSGSSMREGRFVVDFTPEGRSVQAFSGLAEDGRFPPLLTLFSPVKPGSFTSTYLAAADGTPLLLARQAGQGRTAMLLSDSLWRWQMGGSADGTGGKGLYGRFITQLLYWLSPEQGDDTDALLQIVLADHEVNQHQRVFIGAIGTAGSVNCTVKTPSGKSLTMPMLQAKLASEFGLSQAQNGYKCEFTPDELGTYSLEVVSGDGSKRATTMLLSKYPETERTGAVINREFLHNLAEKSGGNWIPWGSSRKLLEGLELDERTIEITDEYPIWNNWIGLAVLMALFCLEWWLRRRWDLV